MTRREYFKRLEKHDWFYAMSDDNRYFMAGSHDRAELKAEAATDSVKAQMLDDYKFYQLSGPHYKVDKVPCPQLDDYDLGE